MITIGGKPATQQEIERAANAILLSLRNNIDVKYPPISVADLLNIACAVRKTSGNNTLKFTVEWQTGSIEGIHNHKITV